MCRIRHLLPFLSALLLVNPPAARADIFFRATEISSLTWPWPAAVWAEDWLMPLQGVVWSDGTAVRFSTTEGGPVYEEIVVTAANAGPIAAVADRTGGIHACFQAQVGGYGLRYAHRGLGGTWSSEWVITGAGIGWYCDVGFVQERYPVVVYVDGSVANTRVLRYARRTEIGWLTSTLDSSGPGEPLLQEASVASDGLDAVHVAWIRGRDVRYCAGPATPQETVLTGTGPTSVSLAVDGDGRPRLVILDDGRLLHAVRTAGVWTVAPILPDRTDVRAMAMTVGYENAVHVVFATADPDDPVLLATEFLDGWRGQAVSDTPTYGLIQRPSIAGGSGALPSAHLVAAWNADGLRLAADDPFGPAFAVARLRAAPLGDLASTVDVYNAIRYPVEGLPVVLDFTAPGVMDTVNFCFTWRDTVRRWTDSHGTATFRLATGGAVHGGIAILAHSWGAPAPFLLEHSVPLAGVDLEGNGSVTPVDRELFDTLLGTGDPRGDLDFSGLVDEADRQLLLDRMGQACTLSGVGMDAADGQAAGPRLGLHPNPASGATTVAWRLPRASPVRVTVHDLAGRRVRGLVDHAWADET
ncbi:MAG: hypothetical protein IH621_07930, partial [Krumholzibacteria bacterium]|nr:hypothetical protein [Candidatus Krumholzibacteria bacterium]